MRIYSMYEGLIPVLFPGRPTVIPGAFTAETSVLVKQATRNPKSEYNRLRKLYPDLLFVTLSPRGADVVLDTPGAVVRYLMDVRGYKSSKNVDRWIERSADEEELLGFFKISVALGKWDFSYMKKGTGVYKLYDAISRGRRSEVVDAWFEVLESRAAGAAVASLLSFVAGVKSDEEPSSEWMRKTYRRVRKMCDLSDRVLYPVLMCPDDIPLEAAGLAMLFRIARV